MTLQVYVDTNFIIAVFEAEGTISEYGWRVLEQFERGAHTAVTSEITLAELLPRPIARADTELTETYLSLLAGGSLLKVVPVHRHILIAAARWRAERASQRLPDAIHVVTAVDQGCMAFLTDDVRLALPPRIKRLRLDAHTIDELEGRR